jgi:hypothetical protein
MLETLVISDVKVGQVSAIDILAEYSEIGKIILKVKRPNNQLMYVQEPKKYLAGGGDRGGFSYSVRPSLTISKATKTM